MGEIIGAAVTGVVIVLGCIFGFCKWVISRNDKRIERIETQNTNHLTHHVDRLEPKVEIIAKDVAYIRGWIDSGND